MDEIWKPIVIQKNGVVYNYEGLYEVSSMGRVRSLDRLDARGHKVKGNVMKLKLHKSGYMKVELCKNGEAQQFLIHRLVAIAFIPNPNNLPVVNHRDECKTNNCIENLEWCTVKYNSQYSAKPHSEETKQKISESHKGHKNPKAKKVICLETKRIFNCTVEASEWCHGNVSMCCRGRNKTAGKHPETGQCLHWQFLDDYKRQLRMQSDVRNSGLVA